MPKPIECLSAVLRQFLAPFRGCFSQRQWKYFVTVLLGLVEGDGRSTMPGFLRVVADKVSLSGLSRFFRRWTWSPVAVVTVWLTRFRRQLEPVGEAEHRRQRAGRPKRRGQPRATVVTGSLICDDSGHTQPRGSRV